MRASEESLFRAVFFFLGLGILVACQKNQTIAVQKSLQPLTETPHKSVATTAVVGGLVPTPPLDLPLVTPDEPAPDASSAIEAIPIQKRAGFSISSPASAGQWAGRLGAGWYLDWQAEGIAEDMPERWKMVRVTNHGYHPTLKKIQAIAKDDPGGVWIIGNEPDVIWQDNVPPETYARSYGRLYDTIKDADPTALIAVGGISQATPLRLQYLDRVLQAYQKFYGKPLPADWWTVHGYVLREQRNSWGVEIPPGFQEDQGILYEIGDHGRLDYFEKQLRDFRDWMKRNGYQDAPLALTEFGILMPAEYGFPPEFVAGYLKDTFKLLATLRDETTGYPDDDYRLVQRWAWFSLADPNFPTSDLADLEQDRLTLVGQAFREFVILSIEH